jgi:hypothetical protein
MLAGQRLRFTLLHRPAPIDRERRHGRNSGVGTELVFLAPVGTAEGVGPGGTARSGQFIFPAARVKTAERVGSAGAARSGQFVFLAVAWVRPAEDVGRLVFGFRVLCSGHGELLG